MKRSSTLLVISQMQIETTRYHVTAMRMATVKGTVASVGKDMGTQEPTHCWQECVGLANFLANSIKWCSHYKRKFGCSS